MRRHVVRLTLGAGVLSLVSAGCVATRDWTHELLGKREVEIDERFVKVETETREHGERLDRVEHQVTQLDTGLSETRALLRASLPPPPASAPSRPAASRPTVRLGGPSPGRTLVGVVHVPFGFDRADLDASAEAALAMILKELRANPDLTLDLEGTTDPVGRPQYNLKLSERRVDAVRRWLVDKGVDPARIVGATARGPLADTAVQNSLKRRVSVKLMRLGS
jgi:outer membrane protein OmpA-like peptidoglycan-associated protein